MPKSKQGPALFEVYHKNRTLELPATPPQAPSAPGRSSVGRSANAVKAKLSSLVKSIGSSVAPKPAEAAPKPAKVRPQRTGSMFAIEDGRLHIVLGSRAAGVAVFALLVLGSIAFTMGQWVGRQNGLADGKKIARESIQLAAMDEIEQARSSQPVKGLFDGIGESPVGRGQEAVPAANRPAQGPVSATSKVSSATPWVKGYTYVVVQNFRGDARQDAVRAQEYLSQFGIETVISGASDTGHRLIATKGFNRKDSTQRKLADRYIKKIRDIGEAYFKAGGRYKLEGFFATLKADSW